MTIGWLGGLSAGEILLILAVVLLLFGARRLPDLARSLGDSRQTIEKLAAFAQQQSIETAGTKPALVPMTFFVSEADHAMLCEAFDKAAGDPAGGTRTQRRVEALKRMAEAFNNRSNIKM